MSITEGDSEMTPATMTEAAGALEEVTETREQQQQQQQPSMPLPERTVTNEEVMIAQALSRIKKNAKVLEKTNKMLGQVLDSLKRAEKESAGHARQVASQNKKLASQIAQLQKRVAKIKSAPAAKPARKKKAAKAKAKPKRR
ncbi:hypothetical protein [Candidatus Nitrososphaera evergladensis]|nr:hypothetical protein [Candidatus Nitrososphaera evergladensis]